MRYILYARKSSESEDRQVQSIDDQIRVLREFAQRVGLQVVSELTEAQSAKAPGTRPVFTSLLEKIEKREADGILCWSINRLARNPVDSGRLSWLLQQGVLQSIRTVDREFLPEDNVLLMAVESGVANQYILDLRKAVIRGMEGRAARGWLPNRPPQGYCVNPVTKEIEPKNPQFQLLRRAWDLLLTGTHNVPQIREKLIAWRYPYGKSIGNEKRLFSESHLYRIFENPFYCGTFIFRGQTYQGKHQPMVTKTEFDQAQKTLHKDLRINPQKYPFAFTGLIRCGNCGCQVTAERKEKHYQSTARRVVYEYYHCTHRKGNCKEVSVLASFVELRIASEISRVKITPEFGRWLLKVLERDWQEQTPANQTLIKQTQERIDAAEKKLERLIELRIAGELSADELSRPKSQLHKEIGELRSRVENLTNQATIGRQALMSAIRFSLTAPRQFASPDPYVKKYVANKFGVNYVLTLGKLTITPHPLLSKLAALEPPKVPYYKVGAGALHVMNRIEWAWREFFRNLVAGLKEDEMCFLDNTPFDNLDISSQAGEEI